MSIIIDLFPKLDVALVLQPEELALPLLKSIKVYGENRHGQVNRMNFMLPAIYEDYCTTSQQEALSRVVMEAWLWLEHEGLIAPEPRSERDWIFITRRGHQFLAENSLSNFKAAALWPKNTLDPQLAAKVHSAFIRADYELAVFEAFKEVEIRVRTLAGYTKDEYGTAMMRNAFKQASGPLTDTTQTPAEQQSASDLFTGAIGTFKNPISHRDVTLDDPIEALELIMFADRLVKMAERRRKSIA